MQGVQQRSGAGGERSGQRCNHQPPHHAGCSPPAFLLILWHPAAYVPLCARYPQAKEQYAELSDMLGLNGVTPDDKVGARLWRLMVDGLHCCWLCRWGGPGAACKCTCFLPWRIAGWQGMHNGWSDMTCDPRPHGAPVLPPTHPPPTHHPSRQVIKLIEAVEDLKRQCGIPVSTAQRGAAAWHGMGRHRHGTS